ncbi:MAG: hypothetical protein MUF68_07535, partial [Cyclobacteriaceae bacterium]|nr:hypothetical protein [Cyclobacteriaceae bacterium]
FKKSYLMIFSLLLILSFSPNKANATGWEDVLDGHAAIVNGCLIHIHTQEFKLFGITWAKREVVDVVVCL